MMPRIRRLPINLTSTGMRTNGRAALSHLSLVFAFLCFEAHYGTLALAQTPNAHESRTAKPGETPPGAPAAPDVEGEQSPLPGDWAPELLDGILSSSNQEASDALYRAAFAAGPAIIPQLEAALKDDRTAEFAAQSLAFIGGEKPLEILYRLVSDPRDLDLRRFYYGALGEYDSSQATKSLLDAIRRSDQEPDRTVTEAAIIALTVRSDRSLVPTLREAEKKVKDYVIRDDLDSAAAVIERRAEYLGSRDAKKSGISIKQAVRTYFMPALMPPGTSAASKSPARKDLQRDSGVRVEVETLTFSPDKTRALARVIFEDVAAVARYDMVLQKHYGDWAIATVWLGIETEKPAASKQEGTSQD
jgi:HEAT repeat protein